MLFVRFLTQCLRLLKVEITNIKDKINAEKKKFGSESWDQAAADDWDGVKTVFATHKAAIDDLLAQLKEKEDAVAALDQPKEKKEEKKDEEEKKKEPPVDDE